MLKIFHSLLHFFSLFLSLWSTVSCIEQIIIVQSFFHTLIVKTKKDHLFSLSERTSDQKGWSISLGTQQGRVVIVVVVRIESTVVFIQVDVPTIHPTLVRQDTCFHVIDLILLDISYPEVGQIESSSVYEPPQTRSLMRQWILYTFAEKMQDEHTLHMRGDVLRWSTASPPARDRRRRPPAYQSREHNKDALS